MTLASQPALDAWYGARDWALEHLPTGAGAAAEGWISKQDYEEKGGEYLSEHCASNIFIPMKITKPVPSRPTEPSVAAVTSAGSSGAATMVTADLPPPTSMNAPDMLTVTF